MCYFSSMRDAIIVAVLCLAAAFIADRVWFGGKYFATTKQELGLDISAVRRR